MQTPLAPSRSTPIFWTIALAGLGWSLFGLFQFTNTMLASEQGLIMGGMTAAQAALYFNLPLWMDIAFAIGVIGGVIGCATMLLRHRATAPVLGLSLAGYIVLFVGDITEGVFAAFGSGQVAILSTVVLIALGLWLAARRYQRIGML